MTFIITFIIISLYLNTIINFILDVILLCYVCILQLNLSQKNLVHSTDPQK